MSRFKSLNSSCVATDQYRHNDQRTGFHNFAQPSESAMIIKHIYPLNVGIHRASKASPAIDDSGIYLGSDTGHFWKMDHEGHKLWSFYAANSDNGFHGTAAVDDKKVYIGAYNGFMYALDKMTGELIWANPVGNFVGANSGKFFSFDNQTGETLWVKKFDGPVKGTLMIHEEKAFFGS